MYRRACLSLSFVAMLFAGVSGPATQAKAEKAVPYSKEQITLSYAPLVKRVAPAVVNVYAKKIVQERANVGVFADPFFQQFFGNQLKGPVRKRVKNSLGSGVIVQSDGIVVTNNHVIDGGDEIAVVLHDGREFAAELILADERTDLAVLRINPEGETLPQLDFGDSDHLEVGDLVLAVGNPFGVGQTVTSGIVSALARTGVAKTDLGYFIQTDAAVNPGNSGGALVTMDGRLVGINTAIFTRSGGSNGIGFAIPATMVKAVTASALTFGKIVRPWLGLHGQNVTADLAESLGLRRPVGVLVSALYPKGAADRADIQVGDVVVSVNAKEVDNQDALDFLMATLPVGGTADITILRKGREWTKRVTLERPPENPPRNTTQLKGDHPLEGTIVANLSPALNEEIGIPFNIRGVMIVAIGQGSYAQRLGIQRGDIIEEVNQQTVRRVKDLVRLLEPKDRWRITVNRGGKTLQLRIGR